MEAEETRGEEYQNQRTDEVLSLFLFLSFFLFFQEEIRLKELVFGTHLPRFKNVQLTDVTEKGAVVKKEKEKLPKKEILKTITLYFFLFSVFVRFVNFFFLFFFFVFPRKDCGLRCGVFACAQIRRLQTDYRNSLKVFHFGFVFRNAAITRRTGRRKRKSKRKSFHYHFFFSLLFSFLSLPLLFLLLTPPPPPLRLPLPPPLRFPLPVTLPFPSLLPFSSASLLFFCFFRSPNSSYFT